MTPAFTVIIPHLREPRNHDALAICLDCLWRNTINDFDLIVANGNPLDYYATCNRLIKQATTDYVLIQTTDMFLAPDWDMPVLKATAPNTIVTMVTVDCGAFGVRDDHIIKDFGRTPETYRRAEFEIWTRNAPMVSGQGWYAPVMIHCNSWIDFEGFNVEKYGEFPEGAADFYTFRDWKEAGKQIEMVQAYAYHLGSWSNKDKRAE